VNLVLRGVDQSYTKLGQVSIQLMQAELRAEKVLRVVTDTDVAQGRAQALEEQELVDETGMFALNQQPGAGDIQLDENTFLEAVGDGQAVKRYINDVSVGKYDVRVVPASYRATNRLAKLQEMLQLQERGIVDNKAVLDQIEMKDKHLLEARVDLNKKIASQLEGAIDQIKQLETQTKRLEGKVASEKIKSEVAETSAQLRVMMADFRASLTEHKAKEAARLQGIVSQASARARQKAESAPAQ